jgi:molybdate transport system substrate-binding protein
MKKRNLSFIILSFFIFTQTLFAASDKNEITVFAAASMKYSLDEVISEFKTDYPQYEVRTNYDSSGTLAQQILAAAGADIFISASKGSMDKVAQSIYLPSRYNMLENKLVAIIASGVKPPELDGADEASSIKLVMAWIMGGKMLSIGNYIGDSPVPAGEYAYKLLNSYDANFFNAVSKQGKLSLAQNVTAVLTQVASGAADIGFVYSTDAATRPQDVKTLLTLTPLTKIVYPAAILDGSKNKESVKTFFNYLKTDKAKEIFIKYGFKTAQ